MHRCACAQIGPQTRHFVRIGCKHMRVRQQLLHISLQQCLVCQVFARARSQNWIHHQLQLRLALTQARYPLHDHTHILGTAQ